MRWMQLNWRQRLATVVILQALLWLGGCGSGGESGVAPVAPSTAQVGSVSGVVVSAATGNAPVAGATVRTSVGSSTSAADGSFMVSAPVGNRSVVHVEANGFAEAFPVARVTVGQTTSLGVTLIPTGVTTTVTVSNGGTVTVPNSTAQIALPADGLVPKDGGAGAGTVMVAVTPINPAVDPRLMPGDYTGVSAGGSTLIESFGALLVDIRDNAGTRYTLAAGKVATIRIPLGTVSLTPPATIPLWYFDERDGLWKEEGTATLQGTGTGRYYEGTVTRVSYWNADQPVESIFISGCVRDNNGRPVADAWVETKGLDYTGMAWAQTAGDGTFRIAMRKNSRATLGLFDFDLQTFVYTALTNTVTVGPSAVDVTLPNCLVKAPGPVTISTEVLPGGTVGVAFNQTLAATGGIPGYVWSLNPGSNPLPAGLSLNASGVISGTPTTTGTTDMIVRVTDSASGIAIKPLSLTITAVGALSITTASPLPSGTVGVVSTIPLTASNGTGTLSWAVVSGALPVGMTLNPSTGLISGLPTTAGTSTFTIRVQDSGSPQESDQKPFSLTITTGSSNGGGGTISVANAPASVGGTFVADPSATVVNFAEVVWTEGAGPNSTHREGLAITFDPNGTDSFIVFSVQDSTVLTYWACLDRINTCGITINRATGTATFSNSVLTDLLSVAPSLTLNGTLNFTPF